MHRKELSSLATKYTCDFSFSFFFACQVTILNTKAMLRFSFLVVVLKHPLFFILSDIFT